MYLFFKRIFDIIFSAIAIILLLPLFIIISIIIKLDSKGTIFFKQNRRGKNGKIFKMIKFRSMVVNAQNMGAGIFNFIDDTRVTKVGKFLRKSSIDELPQIFNIFVGHMSFIGPRPCVENELGDYDTLNRHYKRRFRLKPGMSGLAQVSGRNEISWSEKVVLDNQYIDIVESGKGLFIDIKVLFKTFGKIFMKSEIYEVKKVEEQDGAEAAAQAEEEIIRLAHLPDDIKEETVLLENDDQPEIFEEGTYNEKWR